MGAVFYGALEKPRPSVERRNSNYLFALILAAMVVTFHLQD